jgi:hypothetical protein
MHHPHVANQAFQAAEYQASAFNAHFRWQLTLKNIANAGSTNKAPLPRHLLIIA